MIAWVVLILLPWTLYPSSSSKKYRIHLSSSLFDMNSLWKYCMFKPFLIDSREQPPYKFTIPSERGTLPIGDYSVKGLESCMAVERKEVNDLICCLTKALGRFERELFKAKALDYFALVIEATLSELINRDYRSQMNPKACIRSLIAFSVRYRLPVFFCGSRECAGRVTESLLQKYVREIEKKYQAVHQGAIGKVEFSVR